MVWRLLTRDEFFFVGEDCTGTEGLEFVFRCANAGDTTQKRVYLTVDQDAEVVVGGKVQTELIGQLYARVAVGIFHESSFL